MQQPQAILTPTEFTLFVHNKLKDANIFKNITTLEDLYIIGEFGDDLKIDIQLNNLYSNYKSNPDNLNHFLNRLLASINESLEKQNGINLKMIVPLVRSSGYLTNFADAAHVKLNTELIAVFAEDLSSGFKILSQKDLSKFGLEPQILLSQSISNLANVVSEIEVRKFMDGCYMVIAGGDYESSLILAEIIWKIIQLPIQGDPVFAVPAKDMFLFTGSKNSNGIKKLQEVVDQVFKDGDYLISHHLFTLHESNLVIFKP